MIVQGNSFRIPLADNSVHCCISSYPYYGLRNYGLKPTVWGGNPNCQHIWGDSLRSPWANSIPGPNGRNKNTVAGGRGRSKESGQFCQLCGAWLGCFGLEPTLALHVQNAVLVSREVYRVLRPDGVFWLNYGDSYATSKNGRSAQATKAIGKDDRTFRDKPFSVTELPAKNLIGMPWRVALALQDDGWILRADVIWCLSGGNWIYAKTQKGEMPMMIRDVVRLNPQTVKLWNGEKWTQVLGWSKTGRDSTELELVLRSGERISCTPSHKFPTSRGLLAAGELQIGDVLRSVQLPEPEIQYNPAVITNNAAWFIGLYLAEGSRSGDTIQIAGHAKEIDRLERIRQIAQFYGGSATYTINGNGLDIRVHGRFLNALIDQYISGKTAKNKCLKVRCWSHGNEWLNHLLDGYLVGDGHWDEANKRWRLGFTRNYNLERDLRVLAARLGFKLTLKPYFVELNGKRYPTFKGEIRFETSNHPNTKSQTEIVEIRKARCREVYDIGVADEPHLFALASGVLTHNSKPNAMPESVEDRPSKSHEYIFMLTKEPSYFYDAEAVKELAVYGENRATFLGGTDRLSEANICGGGYAPPDKGMKRSTTTTRNRRSVWTIPTESFSGAHYATFPRKLVEPMILAATSARGVCPECGAPWVRITERRKAEITRPRPFSKAGNSDRNDTLRVYEEHDRVTTGWQPTCKCIQKRAPNFGMKGSELLELADGVAKELAPIPAVILDCFCGSGTVGAVCRELGRRFIGIDLSARYLAENALPRAERLTSQGSINQLPLFAHPGSQAGREG